MGRKRKGLAVSSAQHAELLLDLSKAKDAHSKERLQTVLRAASGRHTLEDLAHLAGRSRSTIQVWIDRFRRGGAAGLIQRESLGSVSPVGAAEVQVQLQAGLKAKRWRTVAEVAAWLKAKHGIRRCRSTIYYWLSKTKKNAS